MNKITANVFGLVVLVLVGLGGPARVEALTIGGCAYGDCWDAGTLFDRISTRLADLSANVARGNLRTEVPAIDVGSNSLELSLSYQSINADASRALLDVGLGYGWTHTHNQLLFSQRGHMFWLDGEGRIFRFRRTGRSSYTATPGRFETLVRNPDFSFTLTHKDETQMRFERVAGDTLMIGGPVWRLRRVTERNERVTDYVHDGSGRLTEVRDLTFGYRAVLGYNASGHLETVIDPLMGRTSSLQYDGTGRRLVKITDPTGNTSTFGYNVNSQITVKTDRAGRSASVDYQNGKPLAIKDSTGADFIRLSSSTNWAIDTRALARYQLYKMIPGTTTVTDGNGRDWRYDYDEDALITKVVAPDGSETSIIYDPGVLLPVTVTDANENTTRYEYDDLGNVTKETDAKDFITTADYGVPLTQPAGNRVCRDQLSRITFPNGSVTVYEYDTSLDANGLHRCTRTKETRDLGGLDLVTEWEYDNNLGLMTLERNPNGHESEYDHDSYGNQVLIRDAEDNETRLAYDLAGNLTCMVDGNGHIQLFEYDALDRPTRESVRIGDRVPPGDSIDAYCVGPDAGDLISAEYGYDGEGNQVLVRRQLNESSPRQWQTTTSHYDHRERLVSEIQDPFGLLALETSHTYDGNDNRLSTTDPIGNTTPDPNDHTTYFEYDVQNRLVKVTDAEDCETETRYDPVGNRTCEIDGNDHYAYYEYDSLNRLVRESRKIGTQECTTGDGDDLITEHFYDTGASMDCFVDPGSPSCAGPMPGDTNIAHTIDPEGRHTHYKYDKLDRRWVSIRKVDPYEDTNGVCDDDDWCEYEQHDGADNVTTGIEANGYRTKVTYFDNDWLESETRDPGPGELNLVTRYTRDGVGSQRTVTNPRGNEITYTYDERDLLIRVEDMVDGPGSLVASYDHDGIGNRTEECDGNDHCTGYFYDAANRLIEVIDAQGMSTFNDYDDNGNLIQVTDRNDHVTCHRYDATNRRVLTVEKMGDTDCSVIDDDDLWTQTDYDCVGNVIAQTTARFSKPEDCDPMTLAADCQRTDYGYDEGDRLTLETYEDGTTRSFAYDDAGNVLRRTDQSGQVTDYYYTDLYYLEERDYQDPAEPDDRFEYDVGGRMIRAERNGWVVTFGTFVGAVYQGDGYDAANRLLITVQDAEGVPMPVEYVYSTQEGLRRIHYPGGRIISELTDLRERLDTVNRGAGPVYPIPSLADFDYDLGNRVTRRTYENGCVTEYRYNDNDWIEGFDHLCGGLPIAEFRYLYDNEGNKRSEEKLHDPVKSEAFAYDDADRLLRYDVGPLGGDSTYFTDYYNLDKLGNWDQFQVDADGIAGLSPPINYNNTPSWMNEYDEEGPDDGIPDDFKDDKATPVPDGENWDHDANGNRAEDGKRDYEYDDENRLIRVTRKLDGVVTEYRYDALGRRVVKTVDVLGTPEVTRYAYDDARVIEEQDALGATLATFVYGNYIDEVLSMARGGADYFYHHNALWSVIALTDALGTQVERYAYTDYGCPTITDVAGIPVPPNAWGTARSAIANPYLFTGRRWDEESGLYYYRARFYDCEAGRFLQRDPLGYVEGMNLYEYVSSMPTVRVDPSGEISTYWICFVACWLGIDEAGVDRGFGDREPTQKEINRARSGKWGQEGKWRKEAKKLGIKDRKKRREFVLKRAKALAKKRAFRKVANKIGLKLGKIVGKKLVVSAAGNVVGVAISAILAAADCWEIAKCAWKCR